MESRIQSHYLQGYIKLFSLLLILNKCNSFVMPGYFTPDTESS